MNTQTENFFEKCFESAVTFVKNFFHRAKDDVVVIESSIAKFGNAVVNEFKTLEADPEIQLLAGWFVKIAEAIDPGLIPLISGIELEFHKIVNSVTGVVTEVSKPIEEQLGDGVSVLKKLQASRPVEHAGVLGTISAAVQNYVIVNNPEQVLPATPAQLLTSAQVIHEHEA